VDFQQARQLAQRLLNSGRVGGMRQCRDGQCPPDFPGSSLLPLPRHHALRLRSLCPWNLGCFAANAAQLAV
jgi:hypothetical protein